MLKNDSRRRAVLSHAVYGMAHRERWAFLTSQLAEDILANTTLPRPQEQLENLIVWFAGNQETPGTTISFLPPFVIASIGAQDVDSLAYILRQGIDKGLVSGAPGHVDDGGVHTQVRLSIDGWNFYEQIYRGKVASQRAFMAMQYGDEQLTGIYEGHFKKAVAATGFELKKLDEDQPAGLIDDRMRVEIRQSRFVIADLTHHNRGAYWEAGFGVSKNRPYP